MGLFTSDTAMLSFDNLRVSKEDVIGEEGRGLAVAYSALLNGRIGIASGCLGVMEDCLNQVKERATSRMQHGKPIGKHQLIQRHIARIASNLESSRWLVYQAALKKEQYDDNKADLASGQRRTGSRPWRSTSRRGRRSTRRTARSSASAGSVTRYSRPVAKHLMDTRVARIYEGTDEMMELKIASTVLGKEFEAYR